MPMHRRVFRPIESACGIQVGHGHQSRVRSFSFCGSNKLFRGPITFTGRQQHFAIFEMNQIKYAGNGFAH